MADQRQVRRHPASVLRVTFEHPTTSGRIEATPWDASLGGMFLETPSPVDEGALVTLEATTADSTLTIDARVLWTRTTNESDDQPAGMAVRFIDLPDDVSVALNRALQHGMQERTILGVGGATRETTTPGVAAPAVITAPRRTPRATQIGIAPQANSPTGSPISETPEASETASGKPRLELSDTSLVDAPAAPQVPESPTPPRRTASATGRIVLLLLLGGAAATVYVLRESIADKLAPPVAAPTATSAPSPSLSDLSPTIPDAATNDGLGSDASNALGALVTSDGGARDAGRHDAGARDAGARDAGRATTLPHGGAGHSKHP